MFELFFAAKITELKSSGFQEFLQIKAYTNEALLQHFCIKLAIALLCQISLYSVSSQLDIVWYYSCYKALCHVMKCEKWPPAHMRFSNIPDNMWIKLAWSDWFIDFKIFFYSEYLEYESDATHSVAVASLFQSDYYNGPKFCLIQVIFLKFISTIDKFRIHQQRCWLLESLYKPRPPV